METYRDLGPFSDLVAAARRRRELFPAAPPGEATAARISEILAFADESHAGGDVRVERRWEADGLSGEEVSWSVGYGPRASGWVVKPADASGPLPGVLALHDHGGFKYQGKEKIADDDRPAPAEVARLRERIYGGRAFANALARRGFVVLTHDVFLWGSRRFPEETISEGLRSRADAWLRAESEDPPGPAARYNAAAWMHEHVVAKYCTLLGTSLAGVVAFEDRVAARYLAGRPDVAEPAIGCVGLSGGGCRAALLRATSDDIAACVIVGMMTTQGHLLDRHVEPHTWMFFPPGLSAVADWPDLAACRAPQPLLVQYCLEDQLFPREGMEAAHERLAAHYRGAGDEAAYRGEFHPVPHSFTRPMQEAAFDWLEERLRA